MKVKTRIGQMVLAWILVASMVLPMFPFGMTVQAAATDYDAMTMEEIMSSKESLTWVFTGDSITHNSLFTSGMNSYVEWFEQYLSCMPDRADDSIINSAIGGSSVDEFVSSCTKTGKGTYNFVTKYNPDVIVYKIGMNNRESHTSLGMSCEEFQNYYQTALDSMYSECLEKYGKVPKIILLSTTPRRHEISTAADCCTDCTVNRRNDTETVANNNDLLFCDLRTAFIDLYNEVGTQSEYQDKFFNDVTHPNGAGQYFIFKNFCKTLGIYDEKLPIFQVEYDDMNKAPLYVDATKDLMYDNNYYGGNLYEEMNKDMPDSDNLKMPELLASIDFDATNGEVVGTGTYSTTEKIDLTATSDKQDPLTLEEVQGMGKEFSLVFRAKVDAPVGNYQTVLYITTEETVGQKGNDFIVGMPGASNWLYYTLNNKGGTDHDVSHGKTSSVFKLSGTAPTKDNMWHTIAYVQTANTFYYYVDGNVVHTESIFLKNDIGASFKDSTGIVSYIGANISDSIDSNKNFDGYMDYYQLYKGALSEFQIKELYSKDGECVDEMGADMPTVTPSTATTLATVDFDSTNGEFVGTGTLAGSRQVHLTDETICSDTLTLEEVQGMGKEFSIVFRAKYDTPPASYQTVLFMTPEGVSNSKTNALIAGVPGKSDWFVLGLDSWEGFSETSSSITMQRNKGVEEIKKWHTIAFVQTESGFKYYLDGNLTWEYNRVLLNDIGSYYTDATSLMAYVGSCESSGDNNKNFDGFMDYYQLYNGALTADEVKTLADNSGYNQMDAIMPTLDLVQIPKAMASIDFDSTNGEFIGTTSYATSTRVDLTDETICENPLTLEEVQGMKKEFSIVFRAKLKNAPYTYETIFYAAPAESATVDGDNLMLGIPGTGKKLAYKADSKANLQPTRSSIMMDVTDDLLADDGIWHTIALVQSETGFKYYVDGEDIAISIPSTTLINDIGSYFTDATDIVSYIGSNISASIDGNKNFNGYMDYYQLYNEALSASQVQVLSNANPVGARAEDWTNVVAKDNLWVFAGSEQMTDYEGFPVERTLYRLVDNNLRRGYSHNRMVEVAGKGYTVEKLNSEYDTLIGKHNYQVFMLLPNMEEVFAENYVHSADKVASFKTALQGLLTKSAGKTQVLWTPLASTDATINGYLADYRDAILEIANSQNVLLFDAYKFMTENMQKNAALKRNWLLNKQDITPLCATDLTHAFLKVFEALNADTQIESTEHNLRFSSDVRPSTIKGDTQRDNIAVNNVVMTGETVTVDLTDIKAAYNLTSVTFKVMPWANAGSYHKDIVTIEDSEVTVSGNKYSFTLPSNNPLIVVYGTTSTGSYRFGEFQVSISNSGDEFIGTTLSLDGTISFNFYISAKSTLGDQAYAEFVLPRDGKQVVKKADAETTSHGIKFACQVPAKEMADMVTATLYDENGAVLDTEIMSVRQYAEAIITNVDNDTAYEAATPLAKSMLHYGAYAQKYFKYNTGNLANKTYASEDSVANVTKSQLSGFGKGYQKKEGFGSLAGASLVLESETTLRMFFQFESGASLSGLKFTVGGVNKSYVKSGNYYIVDFENISASDLDKDFTVTVTAGSNTFNATCSAMTFCYNALISSSNADLQNLAKALYLYNVQANAYFK